MQRTGIIAILILTLTIVSIWSFYTDNVSLVPRRSTTETSMTPKLTEAQTTIPMKRCIEAQVDGVIIHYREELFWNRDYFSEITKNRREFGYLLTGRFKERLSKYGEGRENAVNVRVEFDEVQRSTILTCEVHGAISKSDGGYHATFF